MGNYKNLYLNYKELSLQNPSKANLEKTFNYQRKWEELNDSLYRADLAEQLLELEKKYETEKKNAQIELLSKDNLIKKEKLVIEQQQRRLMIVLILAL
ncbi:MAG: hypothetical protein ACK5JD_02505, partial [Mangrovibacterium sp.]